MSEDFNRVDDFVRRWNVHATKQSLENLHEKMVEEDSKLRQEITNLNFRVNRLIHVLREGGILENTEMEEVE